MRTYSNFLLYEDILDNVPIGSAIIQQVADQIVNPQVKMIQNDCGTLLGSIENTTFELEGKVELATGDNFTRARITTLLMAGIYKVGVRSLSTCTAPGGICQECYRGSYLLQEGDGTIPAIGATVRLTPNTIYQSEVILGNGINSNYQLLQTSDVFYQVVVVNNGVVVAPGNYTLSYDQIDFGSPVPTTTYYTVHFIKKNSEPFLGYIAKTYAGSLLGMKPLPTFRTTVRPSLYNTTLLNDALIDMMARDLLVYPQVPLTNITFIDKIQDRLTRALFIIYMYAFYASTNGNYIPPTPPTPPTTSGFGNNFGAHFGG